VTHTASQIKDAKNNQNENLWKDHQPFNMDYWKIQNSKKKEIYQILIPKIKHFVYKTYKIFAVYSRVININNLKQLKRKFVTICSGCLPWKTFWQHHSCFPQHLWCTSNSDQ
jgi:hypothetical protein